MAGNDKAEKKLEDYNDVFAEILNVLLFKKDLVEEGQLENGPTESIYKAENKGLRGQFRDTAKYYKKAGITISSFGMENQSVTDHDMPVRVMRYDYSSYRSQIDAEKDRYPVITVVLNFSDKKWGGPLHLKDMLEIPEGMEALLDLLEVFTGDSKYAEIKDGLLSRQKEGDEVTMCSIVEKFTNNGIRQDIERGIEQGIEQSHRKIILNMHRKGCNAGMIADLSGISFETVNEILEQNILDE